MPSGNDISGNVSLALKMAEQLALFLLLGALILKLFSPSKSSLLANLGVGVIVAAPIVGVITAGLFFYKAGNKTMAIVAVAIITVVAVAIAVYI